MVLEAPSKDTWDILIERLPNNWGQIKHFKVMQAELPSMGLVTISEILSGEICVEYVARSSDYPMLSQALESLSEICGIDISLKVVSVHITYNHDEHSAMVTLTIPGTIS